MGLQPEFIGSQPGLDAGGCRRSRYRSALERRTKDFCKQHGCVLSFEREIQEMVHEDMHASMGWYVCRTFGRAAGPGWSGPPRPSPQPSTSPPHRRYRIFPTGDDMTHIKAIKNDPVQSKSLTPLDWLMFKWVDAKWSPKHRHDRNGSVVLE